MLDDLIIKSILEKERRKREWQPEPLYLPVDDYEPLPSTEDNDDKKDEEEQSIVIFEMEAYKSNTSYFQ